MPLNFPSNPTNGQTHVINGTLWTYNGTGWTATTTAVNLSSVPGNIIPAESSVYDLGRDDRRWRDIYLSANSINLGNSSIRSSANIVSVVDYNDPSTQHRLAVDSLQVGATSNAYTIISTQTGLKSLDPGGNLIPLGGSGASVGIGSSAPVEPTVGTLWLDSDTGDLSIFYANTWVGVSDYFGSITGATGPVGATGPQGPVGVLESVETFTAFTNSTGTVNHDFNSNTVFHHNTLTGNITVNFSNVPTTDNRIVNFVVMIYQGATAYSISTVQVNGFTQAVNWFDNVAPTGTANKKEVYSFNLVRLASNWYVHGSQSQYG
jgi:hypothetical protein